MILHWANAAVACWNPTQKLTFVCILNPVYNHSDRNISSSSPLRQSSVYTRNLSIERIVLLDFIHRLVSQKIEELKI
jgi:hypothetical protein